MQNQAGLSLEMDITRITWPQVGVRQSVQSSQEEVVRGLVDTWIVPRFDVTGLSTAVKIAGSLTLRAGHIESIVRSDVRVGAP